MNHPYFDKKAEIFKALAQPTRLRILELLMGGERCVCEIYAALDQGQPNVSKHLNLMKRAGILHCRKEGVRILYSIKNPEVLEILRHTDTILEREVEEYLRPV